MITVAQPNLRVMGKIIIATLKSTIGMAEREEQDRLGCFPSYRVSEQGKQ